MSAPDWIALAREAADGTTNEATYDAAALLLRDLEARPINGLIDHVIDERVLRAMLDLVTRAERRDAIKNLIREAEDAAEDRARAEDE